MSKCPEKLAGIITTATMKLALLISKVLSAARELKNKLFHEALEEEYGSNAVINGEKVNIAHGVDEATLKKTPGWLENSAKPGGDGVCVVYGHRNRNHLRALKDVEIGDTIMIETVRDNYSYTIETIRVIKTNDYFSIPTMDGVYLLLSTCFPFHYTKSAPYKCIIVAQSNP